MQIKETKENFEASWQKIYMLGYKYTRPKLTPMENSHLQQQCTLANTRISTNQN